MQLTHIALALLVIITALTLHAVAVDGFTIAAVFRGALVAIGSYTAVALSLVAAKR